MNCALARYRKIQKIPSIPDSNNDALHIDFAQRLRHTLLSLLAKDLYHRLPGKNCLMGKNVYWHNPIIFFPQPEKNVRKLTMNSAAGKKNTASLISE